MTTLHKEQRRRGQRSVLTQQALYRNELRRVTERRGTALDRVREADDHLARLLPGALESGIAMSEIARVTGLSRPTLYRMVSAARQGSGHDARGVIAQLTEAITKGERELGRPPLRHDLAASMGVSDRQLMDWLVALVGLAIRDATGLGSPALVALIDVLPALPKAEKVAVSMALQQQRDLTAIAEAMQMSQPDVAAHLTLGLLRVLPTLRAAVV